MAIHPWVADWAPGRTLMSPEQARVLRVRPGDHFVNVHDGKHTVTRVDQDGGVWLRHVATGHETPSTCPTWTRNVVEFALTHMASEWSFQQGVPDCVALPDGL